MKTMKMRMKLKAVSGIMLMLLAILPGLIGNFLPQATLSSPPATLAKKANPDTVDLETMFLNYLTDWRSFFHSNFNRTGVWVNNWNLTSDYYNYANLRRNLGKYMYSLILAYEVTNDPIYLAEAKWLMDLLMAKQTGDSFEYNKTWLLYERQPTSDYGFFILDAWVWLTWQKLNEYGMGNYDVVSQIDEVKDLAYYDNETDLGWEYYYWQQIGDPDNYICNTFHPMLVLMSYLTNQSVSDYTSDMERIYTAIERFRCDDDFYKYKYLSPSSSELYTFLNIFHQLLTQLWSPEIINGILVQNTLDATTKGKLNAPHNEMVGACIYPLAVNLGYNVPNWYYRAFERAYIYYDDDLLYKQFERRFQTNSKAKENSFVSTFLVSLGVCAKQGWSVTLDAPAMQKSGHTFYFPNAFYNNTFIMSTLGGLLAPMWSANWLQSRFDGVPQGYISDPIWNSTINGYGANITDGGDTFYFSWGQAPLWFNMSVANPRSWALIFVDGMFDDYTCKIIMKNGTVLTLAQENKTINLDSPVFAFEARTSSTAGHWILVKTDNSTITQTTIEKSPTNVQLWIKSTITYYKQYKITNRYTSFTSSDWTTFESWIVEMLTNLYNEDKPLFNAEYSRNATQGYIIHSDANISNYSDQISSQNKLSFTLTYGSGETSNTEVYCGDKGKPTAVYATNGTPSWSYNASTMILTLNVMHDGPANLLVDWRIPGDVNGDGTVDITDLALVGEAYGTVEGDPDYNSDADLNYDGAIDVYDLAECGKNYGKTY